MSWNSTEDIGYTLILIFFFAHKFRTSKEFYFHFGGS